MIDSVQVLHAPALSGAPGSVGQVREVAGRLMRVAKERGVAVILVGHVTKEGALAGPRVLEHLVDCVLSFEGERERTYRTLRALKNRFGSTNEAGVFEMRDEGLVEVEDASARFVAEATRAPGSVVLCAMEGSRPLLVEVQALVAPTRAGAAPADGERRGSQPARAGAGRAGPARGTSRSARRDVFVSLAGGVRVDEPGADLASPWPWPRPPGASPRRRRQPLGGLRRAGPHGRAAPRGPPGPPAGRGGQVRPGPGVLHPGRRLPDLRCGTAGRACGEGGLTAAERAQALKKAASEPKSAHKSGAIA